MRIRFVFFISVFDNGGPYDKRCDDVIAPACREAGLGLYRLDRDPGVAVPIDALQQKIREAVICIADISTLNPNVMYEVGFALALQKDVILISNGNEIPFDVRHRSVILYKTESESDFQKLRIALRNSLVALTHAADKLSDLHPHDVAVLRALLCAPNGLTEYDISQTLGENGPQKVATILSIKNLKCLGFIAGAPVLDFDGSPLVAYSLTQEAIRWLLNNRDSLFQ
jgi:hypothetical protein